MAFDFLADAPVGTVIYWRAALNAHANLPNGASPKWAVISVDEVLVGSKADGTDQDTVGGTESLVAEGVHAGAAVANHAVTQPGAHAAHVVTQPGNHAFTQPGGHGNHVVTQPNNHLDVLNHVHRENRNSATTGALDGWAAGDTSTNTPLLTGYSTANPTAGGVAAQVHAGTAVDAHGAHAGGAVDAHAGAAVDAHSAHAGSAVDAHGVTQPNIHAVKKFHRLFCLEKTVT